jgi:hypothetical protein
MFLAKKLNIEDNKRIITNVFKRLAAHEQLRSK